MKNLEIFEDRPDRFWILMGPFFASAAVRKELPYLTDKPGDVWFVWVEDGSVLGFLAVTIGEKQREIHGVYVHPDQRGNGLAKLLAARALKWLMTEGYSGVVRVTATAASAPIWRSIGFTGVSTRGSYEVMEARIESV